MNWSIFWGVILVLFGLSLIMKVAFNIDFPLVRIAVAVFFIYLGLKIFFGKEIKFSSHHRSENSVIFEERTINDIKDGTEYNVIFSHGIVDLRNYNFTDSQAINIKLNTVFGSCDVLYNDTIPMRIKSTSAFAGTKLPDGNTSAFGTFEYASEGKPLINIETSTVFGQTFFRKRIHK